MPPPYEDADCHRPLSLTLADYTEGFMVRTRTAGRQSTWRATFSDPAAALREVYVCLNDTDEHLDDRFLEVSLWENGRPIEVWKKGRPQMGSGVTL